MSDFDLNNNNSNFDLNSSDSNNVNSNNLNSDSGSTMEGSAQPVNEYSGGYHQTNSPHSEDSSPIYYVNNNNESLNESSESARESSFYTESYRKPKKRRNNTLFQLILVALVSSIVGGLLVGVTLQYVIPAVQPYVTGTNGGANGTNTTSSADPSALKQVQILTSTDSPVTAIAEKAGPSIVGVRINYVSNDFFFGNQQGGGEASGIIIRSDGYIMTNYHVVADAIDPGSKRMANNSKIEIILPNQINKPYIATYIGGDEKTDLAVLKINATNLPVAELGNSDAVKVGEMAVAIGNPGGLDYMGSVTLGIISGLNRTVQEEDGQEMKLIQTDAAINPGNSGGALLNSKGQVIGVNSVKVVAQGFEGLGFAIPINEAKQITDSLIQNGYVSGRPKLGVSIDTRYTEDVAKQNNMPAGLYVADVELMSAAQKAGIQKGDVITKFDGQAVKTMSELESLKDKHKPGDKVSVVIFRNGTTKTVQVTMGEDK